MTRFEAAAANVATLILVACFLLPGVVEANAYARAIASNSGASSGSSAQAVRGTARTRPSAPVATPLGAATGTRAASPVTAVNATAPGQAGFVHYFVMRLPDETVEIQVGIEMPDQRIAWSFPGLGVAVSPFIEEGIVEAGGDNYELWHLYGIRPFPDDTAMRALQRDLTGRIDRWLKTAMPYCGADGPGRNCMSCVGFVLRVLYPGRGSDYPDLPRDFWRTDALGRHTTNDLLLYLTGMLDLPSREARLRRVAQSGLPDGLRYDLEALVFAMGAHESSGTAPRNPAQKSPAARPPSRIGTRAVQRSKL